MSNFLRRLFAKPELPVDPFGEPPRDETGMTWEQQRDQANAIAAGNGAAASISAQL